MPTRLGCMEEHKGSAENCPVRGRCLEVSRGGPTKPTFLTQETPTTSSWRPLRELLEKNNQKTKERDRLILYKPFQGLPEPSEASQRPGGQGPPAAQEANSSWATGGRVSSRPTGAARLSTRCGPLPSRQLKQGLARV